MAKNKTLWISFKQTPVIFYIMPKLILIALL